MQLQHSQKLQMVGTLTGGIAHEFNNLLTPILGYSEILKDKFDENSETYDEVNEIFGASSKAKDLIEQLLIFGRSDNGVSKHRLTQVSGLVDETLKLIKSIITPNIEVVVENCDKQVWIMANRAQVHQVIFNLCTNAFHAMKYKGGVLRVMVNTVCADQAPRNNFNTVVTGEYVRITVSDTGSGISKEAIDKIFEPFFTTKPVGEGTGLGLFVVRKIVETHNGIITVKSEPNQGSKFEVYFAKINDWRNESEEYKPKIDSINATLSVLLIDDKQKVIKVIKKGLESKGFKVIAEINSIDALRIFDDNPARFDVVITDQTMPHIKGLELAERFKQIRPDIKIILITGFVEEQVLECKERRVIDDYMVKPISAEHMAEKIAEVIQKE
jgi:two-component system cell cycle sensor histidine kinase/response regulator CckA